MSLAKGLVAAGVGEGDRVALMAKTRYEWTLADFAIWFAGAVTVPVYETSSAEQVEWILSNSGATACFVESPQHAATIADLRDRLTRLNDVWIFDVGAVDELGIAGAGVEDDEIERPPHPHRFLGGHDHLHLGTTGRPKGCELTHANFVELADTSWSAWPPW